MMVIEFIKYISRSSQKLLLSRNLCSLFLTLHHLLNVDSIRLLSGLYYRGSTSVYTIKPFSCYFRIRCHS